MSGRPPDADAAGTPAPDAVVGPRPDAALGPEPDARSRPPNPTPRVGPNPTPPVGPNPTPPVGPNPDAALAPRTRRRPRPRTRRRPRPRSRRRPRPRTRRRPWARTRRRSRPRTRRRPRPRTRRRPPPRPRRVCAPAGPRPRAGLHRAHPGPRLRRFRRARSGRARRATPRRRRPRPPGPPARVRLRGRRGACGPDRAHHPRTPWARRVFSRPFATRPPARAASSGSTSTRAPSGPPTRRTCSTAPARPRPPTSSCGRSRPARARRSGSSTRTRARCSTRSRCPLRATTAPVFVGGGPDPRANGGSHWLVGGADGLLVLRGLDGIGPAEVVGVSPVAGEVSAVAAAASTVGPDAPVDAAVALFRRAPDDEGFGGGLARFDVGADGGPDPARRRRPGRARPHAPGPRARLPGRARGAHRPVGQRRLPLVVPGRPGGRRAGRRLARVRVRHRRPRPRDPVEPRPPPDRAHPGPRRPLLQWRQPLAGRRGWLLRPQRDGSRGRPPGDARGRSRPRGHVHPPPPCSTRTARFRPSASTRPARPCPCVSRPIPAAKASVSRVRAATPLGSGPPALERGTVPRRRRPADERTRGHARRPRGLRRGLAPRWRAGHHGRRGRSPRARPHPRARDRGRPNRVAADLPRRRGAHRDARWPGLRPASGPRLRDGRHVLAARWSRRTDGRVRAHRRQRPALDRDRRRRPPAGRGPDADGRWRPATLRRERRHG
jgi:hypothetical protein